MAKNSKGNTKGMELSSGESSGELIAQPHGGALLAGGVVGHTGRGGRPSHEIRGSLREILNGGLPALKGYVEGSVRVPIIGVCQECGHEHPPYEMTPVEALELVPKAADQLKAIDIAGRLGLTKGGMDSGLVAELAQAVREELPEGADMDGVLDRIFERWAVPLGKFAAGD